MLMIPSSLPFHVLVLGQARFPPVFPCRMVRCPSRHAPPFSPPPNPPTPAIRCCIHRAAGRAALAHIRADHRPLFWCLSMLSQHTQCSCLSLTLPQKEAHFGPSDCRSPILGPATHQRSGSIIDIPHLPIVAVDRLSLVVPALRPDAPSLQPTARTRSKPAVSTCSNSRS